MNTAKEIVQTAFVQRRITGWAVVVYRDPETGNEHDISFSSKKAGMYVGAAHFELNDEERELLQEKMDIADSDTDFSKRPCNAMYHDPDPVYLRSLIDRAGLNQEAAARKIGITDRALRYYLSSPESKTYRPAPYPVQFALESLRDEAIKREER